MLTLTLFVLAQTPAPECRTSGGVQACGFHCRAELGEVKCAQTPQGLCTRVESQLVCFDPPEEARIHLDSLALAKAVCKSKRRSVECGYNCVDSPNQLQCAKTPYGVCTTRFDNVTCWDPSTTVIHHLPEKALAGAACLQTESATACGWNCKTAFGQVQCAQTPRGTCTVLNQKISCFDPPLPPIAHER